MQVVPYKHRIRPSSHALAHINIKDGVPETEYDQYILDQARLTGRIRLYYHGPKAYRCKPGRSYPTQALKKDAWGAAIYRR